MDLKGKLVSSLMLKFLDFIKPFEVHANANDFAIKGVFMQNDHPITFERKRLLGDQLKLPIHENELYVMANCLKIWPHYLETHKMKVVMDNVSLKYFEMQLRAMTKQLH
jgi:hypothetical protein